LKLADFLIECFDDDSVRRKMVETCWISDIFSPSCLKVETMLAKLEAVLVRLGTIVADFDTISACTSVDISYTKGYR